MSTWGGVCRVMCVDMGGCLWGAMLVEVVSAAEQLMWQGEEASRSHHLSMAHLLLISLVGTHAQASELHNSPDITCKAIPRTRPLQS